MTDEFPVEVIVPLTTGAQTKFYLAQPIRDPHMVYLTGYMTRSGSNGTPIVVKLHGIGNASECSMVGATTQQNSQLGSVVLVANEVSSDKWHDIYPHPICKLGRERDLHLLEVSALDTSTGVALAAPGSGTNALVLRFKIVQRRKTVAPVLYGPNSYSALD